MVGGVLFFLCPLLQIPSYCIPCHIQEKSVLFFAARCKGYCYYMEILICGDCAVSTPFKTPFNNIKTNEAICEYLKSAGHKLMPVYIRQKSSVPVLMLTAIEDEYTQVTSFDEQADDYITKSFSMVLLGRRITALLRRSGKGILPDTIAFGDAIVDFSGYSAKLFHMKFLKNLLMTLQSRLIRFFA